MVWRGFPACCQTELAFLRGKHASKDYIKTIFTILTPFAKIHHENYFDFYQEPQRRRWHFSFLKIMEWSACSADLNPISYR